MKLRTNITFNGDRPKHRKAYEKIQSLSNKMIKAEFFCEVIDRIIPDDVDPGTYAAAFVDSKDLSGYQKQYLSPKSRKRSSDPTFIQGEVTRFSEPGFDPLDQPPDLVPEVLPDQSQEAGIPGLD